MKREQVLQAIQSLHELFIALGDEKYDTSKTNRFTQKEFTDFSLLIQQQKNHNGWFIEENVRKALLELGNMIQTDKVNEWVANYSFASNPKRILIIMAGNLPLVGFHDLLCVLLSGNKAIIKLSSEDKTLLPKLIEWLAVIHPIINEIVSIEYGLIKQVEAVIATGSDNANLHFEKYFGHVPRLFRKNRTSIALITGSETKEELELLGSDMFSYFGKGCRNVTFLLIPLEFNLNLFFEAIVPYGEIINNKKYGNNYDYNRAIHLLNQENVLDNNFVLLKESNQLFSPISMIHYHRYLDDNELQSILELNKENIQVIIGSNFIPFGDSQKPSLTDYADGINTMGWLEGLS
ncbi:MAG: acyl-CoA reductase [Crocinitomicaceae bacterium]|nr:acyl-CoA reductase [Crocinitomicaceae bacterium]MCF8411640.1 acyl-CoA reductase [Crocinitomicaceae bacterium]MCF8444665.1 acyl-CoA reductase [Crocinitomicaceae bacterium]